MEDAVVGVCRDAVDIADGFGRPGGKDEEGAVLTGMETGGFGFPITGDGFFLDMDASFSSEKTVPSCAIQLLIETRIRLA